jgi:hypothetical protein
VVLQIKYGLLQLREQLQIYTGFPFNPPFEAAEPNRVAKVVGIPWFQNSLHHYSSFSKRIYSLNIPFK